jgi:hypothetical protein
MRHSKEFRDSNTYSYPVTILHEFPCLTPINLQSDCHFEPITNHRPSLYRNTYQECQFEAV